MSSFLAKLELDGEIYTVLSCNYRFQKKTDSTSKPTGETSGGEITLSIESNGKTDFVDWILSEDRNKDGKIIFYRRDMMSKLYEIKFEKAYCINFNETFSSSGSSPMQIEFTLVARTLKFNNKSIYKKNWNLS
ncbi:hypothetical protein Ga0061079_1098 [Apibacter mensalis]|uniref:Type VI secretion system needle protein Hcp n=1 Tax=Apibacter mensalis TaxID=1586267 RepID=A0A0X3ANA7_9FLAO|nr:type VI secretion system tube protein TssD [Apibacter mensalis]CVK16619.1 hypothetical protein Ga0061079_1098 [Apibacter mensalis]